MSVTSVTGTSDLAKTLFQSIDTNGDNKIGSDEFKAFLEALIGQMSGNSTGISASNASATVLRTWSADAVDSSGTGDTGDGSATLPDPLANPPVFAGFDASRAQSAAGSLKYDAYNVLMRFDPSDPQSMKKAYALLDQMHPGAFELDGQNNLMLTGTADGYIGSRPLGYNGSSWDDSIPKQWQWFAYNVAHPGPDGRTT